LIERFDIHSANVRLPMLQQIRNQVAADEAARTANDDFLCHAKTSKSAA